MEDGSLIDTSIKCGIHRYVASYEVKGHGRVDSLGGDEGARSSSGGGGGSGSNFKYLNWLRSDTGRMAQRLIDEGRAAYLRCL